MWVLEFLQDLPSSSSLSSISDSVEAAYRSAIPGLLTPRPPIILLLGPRFSIGRKDLHVSFPDDKSVSRSHAEIRVEDGKLFLVDLKSTFGTRVGSKKIDPNTPIELTSANSSRGVSISFGNGISRVRIRPLWTKYLLTPSRLDKAEKEQYKVSFYS